MLDTQAGAADPREPPSASRSMRTTAARDPLQRASRRRPATCAPSGCLSRDRRRRAERPGLARGGSSRGSGRGRGGVAERQHRRDRRSPDSARGTGTRRNLWRLHERDGLWLQDSAVGRRRRVRRTWSAASPIAAPSDHRERWAPQMVDAELHGVGVDARRVGLRATACAGDARAHEPDEHHGRHDVRRQRIPWTSTDYPGTVRLTAGRQARRRGAWLAVRSPPRGSGGGVETTARWRRGNGGTVTGVTSSP
jgi:hypothetical protein